MKVMVIGGGLFGVHIANTISKQVEKVDIFEYSSELFSGASSNNQHRFHVGLHYPRSDETIQQIKSVMPSFYDEFGDCIFPIDKNIYLIEKESKTTATEFYRKFIDSCNRYDKRPLSEYVNFDKIDDCFLTCEKGLDLTKIKSKLTNKLSKHANVSVIFNCKEVEKHFKDYDLVANCSYWSANLTSDLKIKYELCALVRMEMQDWDFEQYSFTVMDGEFPSLYKTETPKIYTLSSVPNTPFFRTEDRELFKKTMVGIRKDFDLTKVNEKIINHGKEYFKLGNVRYLDSYISPKIKLLDDTNDKRTSEMIVNGKFITLLQGKISTLSDVASKVSKAIDERN